MAARGAHDTWSQFFDVGKDILEASANSTTGQITCQTGNSVDSTPSGEDDEIWAPAGYYAVPAAPTPGKPSCQSFKIKGSDYDICVGTRDPRDAKVIGNLKAGDRVIAGGYPSQSRCFVRADGSVSLVTTDDNTSDGNAVFYRVSPTEGRFWSPWGSQVHDHTGLHLRTWHGAKLDLFGLSLPAPFNAYGSMIGLQADIVTINAATLSLGRDQGLSSGAVLATQFQAVVATPMASAITALAAQLGAAGSALSSGNTGAAGAALTSASGTLAAIIVALGTVSTACASKTSIS